MPHVPKMERNVLSLNCHPHHKPVNQLDSALPKSSAVLLVSSTVLVSSPHASKLRKLQLMSMLQHT
jgi:hypothetical protein